MTMRNNEFDSMGPKWNYLVDVNDTDASILAFLFYNIYGRNSTFKIVPMIK